MVGPDELHPEDRDRAVAGLSETTEQGASRTEYRMRHEDGTYRWVEDNRRLIRDAANQPKELVGEWRTNITERKSLREKLWLRDQLLESFFQHNTTAGSCHHGLWFAFRSGQRDAGEDQRLPRQRTFGPVHPRDSAAVGGLSGTRAAEGDGHGRAGFKRGGQRRNSG